MAEQTTTGERSIPEGWREEKIDDIRRDPPDPECIYCGRLHTEMTDDHVPPDNLYKYVEITHEQVTAPACKLHNNAYSQDDERFRNIIVHHCANDSQAAADLLAGSVQRGTAGNHPLKKIDYDETEIIEQITPSGIYVKRKERFTFSSDERQCMLRMYDRFAKAIYWYYLGQNPVARRMKLLEAWEAKEFYEGLKVPPTMTSGNPEIFQYRVLYLDSIDHFIIWTCFFKKLMTVSIAYPADASKGR